jgi:hypothetical protein
MSFSTVVRDIEARLIANWATTVIDINPNADFKPPAYDTAWIKLRIFNEKTDRTNVGNPGCHRTIGTIIIQIFTPLNSGTRTAIGYGDTLAEIFRDQQFNGITCREAHVEDVGEMDGRWQTNLIVPFYWDARHTV